MTVKVEDHRMPSSKSVNESASRKAILVVLSIIVVILAAIGFISIQSNYPLAPIDLEQEAAATYDAPAHHSGAVGASKSPVLSLAESAYSAPEEASKPVGQNSEGAMFPELNGAYSVINFPVIPEGQTTDTYFEVLTYNGYHYGVSIDPESDKRVVVASNMAVSLGEPDSAGFCVYGGLYVLPGAQVSIINSSSNRQDAYCSCHDYCEFKTVYLSN
jgi:hypothetical protein